MISVVEQFCYPVQNNYMSKIHSLRAFLQIKRCFMSKKVSMEVINPCAAGIDVGSRSHYAAIGQKDTDGREFGVYNENLLSLAKWLLENGIKTVAMESTGTYWQSLYATLQSVGLDVILCNGKFIKNIKGKKTDVQDCQWIQKLHALGLFY